MNEYFSADGHLSDYALQSLINGEENELRRLEAAEHLAFCDECTERYSAMLCDDCLVSPLVPVAPAVLSRIKKQARVIFLNRYVAAGAAACFTIMLWVGGFFNTAVVVKDNGSIKQVASITETYTAKTLELSESFTNGISDFFNGFELKGVFFK